MLRSPQDRDIARLALPALGALAAEPLYLLVDTAIVGHLGTPQLAALALAATVLTTLVTLCIFLTYGTTAQVARLHGAGHEVRAGELAAQALWLAVTIGAGLALACIALADPLVAVLGGRGETARMAARYLRLSAAGLPLALVALAGQGYLRGVGDLRTPLLVVVAAQLANVVLELWFVYGLEWGLDGSAAGTVIAQLGMGAAFAWLLLRAPAASRAPRLGLMRPLLRISGELFVRSAALLVAFATASAILARVGEASLAAHQIAMGLFVFAALVAGCLFGAVLLALSGVLPHAFTDDPQVIDRAQAIWAMFALMQPAAAVVFALDGILIGAGDTRYLAGSMLLAGIGTYVPIALIALAAGWGIQGVWAGLLSLMAVRLLTLGWRFGGRRWAV